MKRITRLSTLSLAIGLVMLFFGSGTINLKAQQAQQAQTTLAEQDVPETEKEPEAAQPPPADAQCRFRTRPCQPLGRGWRWQAGTMRGLPILLPRLTLRIKGAENPHDHAVAT